MSVLESLWIKRWKEAHVFEPPYLATEKPKFFFTVPYAYPTGPLHVGHGRTYTNGDVIARFERVKGNEVLWPMGFHVTGTPVLAICDAIKRGDEKTIALYRDYLSIYEKDSNKIESLIQSFVSPNAVAEYFAGKVSEDLDLIGCSIDWRPKFTTMDPEYQKFIHWQFKKLLDEKVLVKGKYPILYSPVDKNAVGEDDIKDGDTDKVAIQEFYLLKFKLTHANTYVVISTLRPETMFGATHIWVNPQNEYVKARVDGEEWIVAKKAIEKLEMQTHQVEILGNVNAEQLLTQKVEHPLLEKTELPILPANFVSAEKGTGVVVAVPAHAPWDYMALKALQQQNNSVANQITPKVIIELPNFPGMEKLLEEHKATSMEKKSEIQRATEDIYKREFYDGKMNDQNMELSGLPVKQAKEAILKVLSQLQKSGILYEPSRRAETRAGNPVQVGILEDQWFIDYSNPEWKAKTKRLVEQMPITPERFKRNILDAIDWLERRPCIRKRGLGTNFPFENDNNEWMIEPLSDSTIYMLFYLAIPIIRKYEFVPDDLDEAFWDAAILGKGLSANDKRKLGAEEVYEHVLFWYPNDLRHTAPAHISNHISFYLFTHTLLFEEKYWPKALSFNEMLVRNGVKMSKSKGNVIPLQHAVRDYGADLTRLFIVSSAGFERTADWRDNQVPQVQKKLQELETCMREAASLKEVELTPAQEWLAQGLRRKLNEAFTAYEQKELMTAAQKAFFETLNEVKRFKKVFTQDEKPAVRKVLKEWIVLTAPIAPFLSEEMWALAGFDGFASKQVLHKPEGNPSAEIDARVAFVEQVLGDVERVKKFLKGKKASTLYAYSVDPTETAWLQDSIDLLKQHTNVDIKINDAHDPLGKMQKAQKGRPALYLE